MKTENQDLNMFVDGLEGMISEIRDELVKINKRNEDNPEASLSIDLLNRISETIGQAKKGITAEELKVYSESVVAMIRQAQQEAKESFAKFLNEKVEELRQIAKMPSIVRNEYSIGFKKSRNFTAIVLISLGLLCSLFGNYNQYKSNNELTDADWKYRFVKMNGGIYTDDVFHLERMFGSPDSVNKVKGLKGQILDHEMKLREQIEKQEQIDRNRKENEKLGGEIEKLKGK